MGGFEHLSQQPPLVERNHPNAKIRSGAALDSAQESF
jgi:hypothetical protein